jgi:hypothetical protein
MHRGNPCRAEPGQPAQRGGSSQRSRAAAVAQQTRRPAQPGGRVFRGGGAGSEAPGAGGRGSGQGSGKAATRRVRFAPTRAGKAGNPAGLGFVRVSGPLGSFGLPWRPCRDRTNAQSTMGILPHFRRCGYGDVNRLIAACSRWRRLVRQGGAGIATVQVTQLMGDFMLSPFSTALDS